MINKQRWGISKMTNGQKQELLTSVDILQKAHKEIESALRKGNVMLASDMLAKCQETAVAMGEYIEKFENEKHVVISCLEEYCEVVFRLYEQLMDTSISKNGLRKVLGHQLVKMENGIKNDIISKKEIVFFPYKVSMWDSLESIYLAAMSDPECDAYCVPIPYFDRDENGEFRQLHYEGNEYPKYVRVVDWRYYDYESRKPDIAYIHNLYDNQNLVTSVHPRYYSGKLKKYVGMLVYVPYNVTGGVFSEVQKSLPVYFNVNQIVVQHKRQIPFFPLELREKVCAFGSPKFDKVINYEVVDEMIPSEWKPKLRDTVIFVNTGINGLLVNNEKCLLKIQYILEIAKKEGVTLLWRPHPLLEATIRSMRPKLWELYQDTIEKFCKYENAILDQTGNVELAIKLCDAYVGEATSSVSHMFGVLGKPIFFVRYGILNEYQDIENLKINCCTGAGNVLWASAASRNGLLKISQGGTVEKFYIIPNERDGSNLYGDILINEGKVYLIPRNATEIAVFDIEKERFTKIVLSDSKQKEKFSKGYLYNNKIYLIPRLYKKMVILNCSDGSLGYNTAIVKKLKEITCLSDIFVLANGSRLINDSIYFAAPNKPYLLEFDLKIQKSKIHRIPGTERGFCCLEKVSDKIILGSLGGCELIVWNFANGTSRIITDFPLSWNRDEKICFWDIVESEGNAYIFPRKNPMILKLSLDDLSVVPLEREFPFSIQNRKDDFFNHPEHFLFVKKLLNGTIVVQDANRHGLSKFCRDGSFKWSKIALTEEDELKAFRDSFSRQGSNLPWGICETKYHSVRCLISYVRRKYHDEERQKKAFLCVAENLDGTTGQKIHAFITGKLGGR
ncbi:MAG: hypothetical protein HFH23_14715 [Ruminococcus sp.]|nr:hypothetical protein [Ruminococcus sp.]